jgi:hypothetical protein
VQRKPTLSATGGAADHMTDHARLFAFEHDFFVSLRYIPMAVRFKLDRSGIKLSLCR